MTIQSMLRAEAAARRWVVAVSEAAIPFESRWTRAALKRVDADVHRRLVEQRGLFEQAVIAGSAADIELHGAALCRGYIRAALVLEAAAVPDDAYTLGQDPSSGFRVAIGAQRPAAQRARELHGQAVVWITPDEVAAIVANLEAFKPIAAIKRLFPGAEILAVRPAISAKTNAETLGERSP